MKSNHFRLLLLILFGTVSQHIHTYITVENKTKKPIFVASYCYPVVFGHRGSAVREYEPIKIDEGLNDNRVGRKRTLSCDRRLLFSHDKEQLKESINADKLPQGVGSVDTGGVNQGNLFNYFYVVEKNDKLEGYNTASYVMFGDEVNSIESFIQLKATQAVLGSSSLINEDPHRKETAQIRIGKGLCPQELSYVNKRKATVKKALEELLGEQLNGNYVPTIAAINSGGGTRAMISMLGFHIGSQNTGLLNTITYDVGLSGGSWFVSLWMHSKKNLFDFKDAMRSFVQPGIIGFDSKLPNERERELFAEALMLRAASKQPISLVNIWGALIANRYLVLAGNDRQQVRFSDCVSDGDAGRCPFPILVASNAYDFDATIDHRARMNWYEFTPYEVGGVGSWLGDAFVPTWALGRKFNKGTSTNNAPECDLGLLMGIWGSAFGVTLDRIKEELRPEKKVLQIPYDFLFKHATAGAFVLGAAIPVTAPFGFFATTLLDGKDHVSVGYVHSFVHDMADAPYRDKTKLTMVDSGLSFNLPYPPISGNGARKADIIIVFDASGDLYDSDIIDLQLMQKYAQLRNLKFPPLPSDMKAVSKSAISIFKNEEDPAVPVIIYLPAITDAMLVQYPSSLPKGFNTNFPTMKFAYNSTEFDNLSVVPQYNVEQCIDTIKDAIRWKIAQNQGFVKATPAEELAATSASAGASADARTAMARQVKSMR